MDAPALPRYYVAAVGFGWGIYDRQCPAGAPPSGPHCRVWYRTARDLAEGAKFPDVHVVAKTECQRLNDGGEVAPE